MFFLFFNPKHKEKHDEARQKKKEEKENKRREKAKRRNKESTTRKGKIKTVTILNDRIEENSNHIEFQLYKNLVYLCSAVYEDGTPLGGDYVDYPYTPYECNEQKQAYMYTSQENRTQILAIRGTDSFKDMVTDVKYVKAYNEELGMYVHSGFNAIAIDIWNVIQADLVDDPEWKLYITGHSLGGALAVLCGMFAVKDGNQSLQKVVTFGQPKLTNAKGCKVAQELIGDAVVRIANESDIITRIPYKSPITYFNKGFYRHFGVHVHIYDNRKTNTLYKKMTSKEAIQNKLTSLGAGVFGRNDCFGYYHGLSIENSVGYIANLEDILSTLPFTDSSDSDSELESNENSV